MSFKGFKFDLNYLQLQRTKSRIAQIMSLYERKKQKKRRKLNLVQFASKMAGVAGFEPRTEQQIKPFLPLKSLIFAVF